MGRAGDVNTGEIIDAKVQQALAEQQLDALVAVSPWNVKYTAGTAFFTQRTIPERLALVVMMPGREPTFIYCTIEDEEARGFSWITDLRGYTEFAEQPITVLADLLRERGAARGRVGIEKRFLVARNYDELLEALPDAEIVAADQVFDRMRAIKTTAEIEALERTVLWTDAAVATAFSAAKPGDTTRMVGDRMIAEAMAKGSTGLLHIVLGTGPNLSNPHAEPNENTLEPGGVLRTDFGMFWDGYVSDIARTAFIAPATQRQIDDYKTLEEIHQTVIASMKPGVRACDVYRFCVENYAKRGLEFALPHVGHSIGLLVHEQPMLQPFDETPLEAGMVLMLEPPLVAPEGLYHTEDMIEITETGQRILSRSRDWSEPLIIG
jgi:Xaa-Pro dipeptidase